MKNLITVFALVAIVTTGTAQKTDRKFVNEVVDFYKKQSSISYDINYKIKYYDNDDTITQNGNCKMIRDTKDIIFGAYFWYDVKNNEEINYSKYFDGNYCYYIDHKGKAITRFNAKKGDTNVINGATDGEMINIKFMRPHSITEYINERGNITTYADTMINKNAFGSVRIDFANEEGDQSRQWLRFHINKKTKIIERITFHVTDRDQSQHNEWHLTNVKFNTIKRTDLEKSFADLNNYNLTDYKEPTEEERAPLANGQQAPDFMAKSFQDNGEFTLADFNGKIVVLDFWYMSCQPCAMAVPHLTSLQKKYGNDVVILGLNPFDTNEKAMAKIPAFITRNNLDYRIAAIGRETAVKYKVSAYPTLYVIKDGIIHHSEIGFNENLEHDLDAVIAGLLKK